MLHLFVKTARPFLNALSMWLEEGKLQGNCESWFMVAKSAKFADTTTLSAPAAWGEGYILKTENTPSIALLSDYSTLLTLSFTDFLQPIANEVLVSGKSIVLLQEIFAGFSQNYEKTPEQQKINIHIIGPAPKSVYDQFSHEVLEYFPQNRNTDTTTALTTTITNLRRINLDIVDTPTTEKIIPFTGPISAYIGEEVSPFLHYLDMEHGKTNKSNTTLFTPQPLPTISNDFQGNFDKYSPLPENSFTLQPISVIVQKGIIEPILDRYRDASQKLMRYLHEICLLHQNLSNLRAFFLMEAGFAFHQFTLSLFNKVDRGEVLGIDELNHILQDSLISAGDRESYLKKSFYAFCF